MGALCSRLMAGSRCIISPDFFSVVYEKARTALEEVDIEMCLPGGYSIAFLSKKSLPLAF